MRRISSWNMSRLCCYPRKSASVEKLVAKNAELLHNILLKNEPYFPDGQPQPEKLAKRATDAARNLRACTNRSRNQNREEPEQTRIDVNRKRWLLPDKKSSNWPTWTQSSWPSCPPRSRRRRSSCGWSARREARGEHRAVRAREARPQGARGTSRGSSGAPRSECGKSYGSEGSLLQHIRLKHPATNSHDPPLLLDPCWRNRWSITINQQIFLKYNRIMFL